MKESIQRFYYKQIYANRKIIKDTTEAVLCTLFTWAVLSFISFHFLLMPNGLNNHCSRDPRNGFTTLYYWFETPGRTAGCWLWQSNEPKKLTPEEHKALMDFINPRQECDLFSKEAK